MRWAATHHLKVGANAGRLKPALSRASPKEIIKRHEGWGTQSVGSAACLGGGEFPFFMAGYCGSGYDMPT